MPEMIERTDTVGATADAETDAPAEVRPGRWTRTHTIWTLIALSLIPGFVIALFRVHWLEVHAGVKAAVYLTSAMLIAVAAGLIMFGGGRRSHDS
jgi:hypothetical protein